MTLVRLRSTASNSIAENRDAVERILTSRRRCSITIR